MSKVYDLFQYCLYYLSFFFCFPPELIVRSRFVGACPVTTDCIVAISSCENNNGNSIYFHGSFHQLLRGRPCTFVIYGSILASMEVASASMEAPNNFHLFPSTSMESSLTSTVIGRRCSAPWSPTGADPRLHPAPLMQPVLLKATGGQLCNIRTVIACL